MVSQKVLYDWAEIEISRMFFSYRFFENCASIFWQFQKKKKMFVSGIEMTLHF